MIGHVNERSNENLYKFRSCTTQYQPFFDRSGASLAWRGGGLREIGFIGAVEAGRKPERAAQGPGLVGMKRSLVDRGR